MNINECSAPTNLEIDQQSKTNNIVGYSILVGNV